MPTEIRADGKINTYVDALRENGWTRRRGTCIYPDGIKVPYWLEFPQPAREIKTTMPWWVFAIPVFWPLLLFGFALRECTRDVTEAGLAEQHRQEQQRAPLAVHPEAIDSVIPDPLPEWGRGR